MAKVYEFFEEGWKIPVGEYGNLVFENSHIVIYSEKEEGEVTTTAFSLDNDNRLVKKTMTSKLVKVTEQWEEVIETPDVKAEDIFGNDDYDLVAFYLDIDREAVKALLKSNFIYFTEQVNELLSSPHLLKGQKEQLKNAVENIKTQQEVMYLPDEYYAPPEKGQEYFELCQLFLMTIEGLKKLLAASKVQMIKRALTILAATNSSEVRKEIILSQIEALEKKIFAMQ